MKKEGSGSAERLRETLQEKNDHRKRDLEKAELLLLPVCLLSKPLL